MNKINKYISLKYRWYVLNIQKLILVVGVHISLSYILKLPYINIFANFFIFLPYFIDWILILVLFKLRKELILRSALLLFGISYFFALVKLNSTLELFGEIGYLMIGTYLILSFQELRKK